MSRNLTIGLIMMAVGVVAGYIVYQYGVENGVLAGSAGVAAVAANYRRRGKESARVDAVVDDARQTADQIRDDSDQITEKNIDDAKSLSGSELAAEVDKIT